MTTNWALIKQMGPYTKASPERLQALVTALGSLDNAQIAGDVVECGVYRGANIILTRMVSPDRVCWLYDTFDGMTEPDPDKDISYIGRPAIASYERKQLVGAKWARASREEVEANIRHFGLFDLSKLVFVEGDVRKTLTNGLVPERIALLYVDVDWYDSTKICLEKLYPFLVRGGILFLDDYGHWKGAQRAVNEFFHFDPLGQANWERFTKIDKTAVMMVRP